MQIFNEGDYVRAVEQKIASETISRCSIHLILLRWAGSYG